MSGSRYRAGPPLPRQSRRPCPSCGEILDGATEVVRADAEPVQNMKVGDLTICAYCAAPLEVRETDFRQLSSAEVDTVAINHPEFKELVIKMGKGRQI